MRRSILLIAIILVSVPAVIAEEVKQTHVQPAPTPAAVLPAVPHPTHDGVITVTSGSEAIDKAYETNVLVIIKQRELDQLQRELRQLHDKLGTNPQIVVRIQMLEVSLTKLRRMKTDFATLQSGIKKAKEGEAVHTSFEEAFDPTKQPFALPDGVALTGLLDWLEQNRIAKVLARPTIIVASGRPGSFFVGNEIPMPSREDSKVVEYQKCGTEVDLTAVVKDNNRTQLNLRIRVSELNESQSMTVNGRRIPALAVRQCDTAVETTFGQPVVLNGLVETRVESQKTIDGVKDVDNQIMLMIVAIPELVQPMVSAAPQPAPYNVK